MKKQQRSARDAGPLSLYAEGFRELLEGKGCTPESVRWRQRQFAALNRWLLEHRLAVDELDAACVERLVAARRAEGRTTFVAVANFSVPVAYLREIGVVPPEATSPVTKTTLHALDHRHRCHAAGMVESP